MDLSNRNLGRVLSETVRLPDMSQHPAFGPYLKPGIYDAQGGWVDDLKPANGVSYPWPQARVVIEFAGVNVIWGAFRQPLAQGQVGALLFTNVPGTAPITSMFGEWNTTAAKPRLSPAVFQLISSQRGVQTTRIVGRNTFDGQLPAAAGFILSPNANVPQP